MQFDKPPRKEAAKADLISCLRRQRGACDVTVINKNCTNRLSRKCQNKQHTGLTAFGTHAVGNIALRLQPPPRPTCNCGSNPSPYCTTSRNVGAETSLTRFRELGDTEMASVTEGLWHSHCHQDGQSEDKGCENAGVVSDVLRRTVMSDAREEVSSEDQVMSSDGRNSYSSHSDPA